jgi:hypothetical protein
MRHTYTVDCYLPKSHLSKIARNRQYFWGVNQRRGSQLSTSASRRPVLDFACAHLPAET